MSARSVFVTLALAGFDRSLEKPTEAGGTTGTPPTSQQVVRRGPREASVTHSHKFAQIREQDHFDPVYTVIRVILVVSPAGLFWIPDQAPDDREFPSFHLFTFSRSRSC